MRRYGTLGTDFEMRRSTIIGPGFATNSFAAEVSSSMVVADHSARPGDGANVTKSLHRIEESVVRRELEAVGFQFVAAGDFLRNPADARDTHVNKNPVPNDEFVLKYRKPQ